MNQENHLNVQGMFKPVFILLIAALLVPGISLYAMSGDSNDSKIKTIKIGTQVKRAGGTLIQWKDVPKITLERMGTKRRLKPVMNFKNPRPLVRRSKAVDPAAQTTYTGKKGLTRSISSLSTPIDNFDGMSQVFNGAGWPPDPNGDVGVTYYVQAVNTSIAKLSSRLSTGMPEYPILTVAPLFGV